MPNSELVRSHKIQHVSRAAMVSLPKVMLEILGWKKGTRVDLVLRDGEIGIRPHEEQGELSLALPPEHSGSNGNGNGNGNGKKNSTGRKLEQKKPGRAVGR